MMTPEKTLMHRIQLPGGGAIRIECYEGRRKWGEDWRTVDVFVDHPDGTDQLLYTVDQSENRVRSMIFDRDAEDPVMELDFRLREKVAE